MINPASPHPAIKPSLTIGLILSCLVFITTLVTSFEAFLPARVAAGLPFRITNIGPNNTPTLIINQENAIEWDTRPENVSQYPAEAISLCPANIVTLAPDCQILDFYTDNDGAATVFVPPTFSPGNYNLVFTAWNTNRRLAFDVNNAVQIQLLGFIPPSPSPEPAATDQTIDILNSTPSPSSSPTFYPSPSSSPTPTDNASLQIIILNQQPVQDAQVRFILSNIDPETIDCVAMDINGQPATFNGNLPTCN